MKQKTKIKYVAPDSENYEDGLIDFGGLPKDVDLKKNIGCASTSLKKKTK